MGYGGGYQYPHDFDGHYVPEEYLPDALRGERFYEPSGNGEEGQIRERLDRWRREAEERRRAEEAESAAVSAAARSLDK